jgi:hypothetical protein
MLATKNNQKLMGRDSVIAAIFDPESAPSPRTWETWKKRRIVPVVRIGRLCYYDPEAVRTSLERFTFKSKEAK